MDDQSIVLLTKADRFSADCAEIAARTFGQRLTIFSDQVGAPFPLHRGMFPVAGIISFLSPWIVPRWALEACGFAINFHPGSAAYPGIGCYNFAIYEGAEMYGAVCHHMEPTVDTGALIAEAQFPIMPDESVASLKLRTMIAMNGLFAEIVDLIAANQTLPQLERHWSRRPFTRKELNELCIIDPEMDDLEKSNRIRATTFPGYPGPVLRQPDGSFAPVEIPDRLPIA